MIPQRVLREVCKGFGLRHGREQVLSRRFGKVCLSLTGHDGVRTQLRLVPASANTAASHVARLTAETGWVEHLARRHRLAVPQPLRWSDGGFVSPPLTASHGVQWLAIAGSWVRGRHLNRGLRACDMQRAGALLAQLHNANADVPNGIVDARPIWGIPRLFEIATTLRDLIGAAAPLPSGVSPSLADALRSTHTALHTASGALPTGAAHIGLIHTDAHWQNLRFSRQHVGIVDFEDVATGRFMLDIACVWGKVAARRDSHALLDALLAGYDRGRPLTDGYARDLRVMSAFRYFDYAGWVLSWPRIDSQAWGPAFLAEAPDRMRALLER